MNWKELKYWFSFFGMLFIFFGIPLFFIIVFSIIFSFLGGAPENFWGRLLFSYLIILSIEIIIFSYDNIHNKISEDLL